MPKAVGTPQAARLLECSLGWVYTMLRSGELPGVRQSNGEWLIPVAAINERRKRKRARLQASTKMARVRIPKESDEQSVPAE